MALDSIQSLVKALEAGNYNAAPSTLTQGAALQVEDLSPVMHNVTFTNEHIKLQKMVKVESCKSVLAQFDRQLSYGQFGGSAQLEGAVGQEETSDYVRVVVPMAFYSHTRRTTIVANLIQTVDGKKADERAAADAALKIAADIEFDLFRGKADFSNNGVFDGDPRSIPNLPNMMGVDCQVRQSDMQSNAKDLMFAEFGSDLSVVISGGGVLTQQNIEDAYVRSAMNLGHADLLLVDPLVLSAYNILGYQNKERILLGNTAQQASGASLNKQFVSGGTVNVEASRFLSGKFKPQRPRANGPAAPTVKVATDGEVMTGLGTSLKAGSYVYYVTAANRVGESPASAPITVNVATDGDGVKLEITPVANAEYFNVYRSPVGGSVASARFIGRVANMGTAVTYFKDLGNRIPGFVTGYLIQGDTMAIKELAPYSRLKLAVTDLSTPEAHFRFCTLAVMEPRKNVLIDNLKGNL